MWIEDYRRSHNMELDEFARYVNHVGRRMRPALHCHVSDTLIHMLECDASCVTHPRIANAIAIACEATAKQRDMLVNECHYGEWTPEMSSTIIRTGKKSREDNSRAVVKIDRYGNTLEWFRSVADAARSCGHSEDTVRRRCGRRVPYDITTPMPYTFRFDAEWSRMTSAEKIADIKVACKLFDY